MLLSDLPHSQEFPALLPFWVVALCYCLWKALSYDGLLTQVYLSSHHSKIKLCIQLSLPGLILSFKSAPKSLKLTMDTLLMALGSATHLLNELLEAVNFATQIEHWWTQS